MKPEPVRPLHGSILRAQKNCKLPLISKKVGRALSLCPSDAARSWAGTGCQKQSLPCQGRTKPWNLLYRWKSSHFPQSSKSTAAEPAPKGDHQSPCPQPRAEPRLEVHVNFSASPTLQNQSSPTAAALISNPRDGWNFPWFTATGEKAQWSQNASRGSRISAWAFVSSAQQKGHCPCSTD